MHVIVPDSLASVVPVLQEFLSCAAERLDINREAAAETQPGFEREIRALSMAVERAIHQVDLARFDVDEPGLVMEGGRYRRAGRSNIEVLTMAGSVLVARTVYRERGGSGGASVGALELQLGLVDGRTTPAAAEMLSEFVATNTPAVASDLISATGTLNVSKSSLDRLAKAINRAWEPRRVQLEEAVRLRELRTSARVDDVRLIAFSLDGVMIRMKDAPNTPGAGKDEDVPHGHQEATSATVSLYDSTGDRLRTVGLARMPESKKATLHAQLLAEVEATIDRHPNATLVALSDAAVENWRILDDICAALGIEAVRINDYFHAAEHLAAGLKAGGYKPKQIKKWCERLRDEEGAAELCLAELARLLSLEKTQASAKAKRVIEKEVTYFNNNVDRMRYAEYQRLGYPIGSGVQEAACKTYVGHRFKQSGMSWRHQGQGVLTLRALLLSGRLNIAWTELTPHLRRDFSVDDNTRRKMPAPQGVAA
ncbi:MAG: hypothetical protein KC609_24655 [Myxococcales bacterium]|nr:hypothetical protein [Myxococcales bacterium]